jgi:hypothetical protein
MARHPKNVTGKAASNENRRPQVLAVRPARTNPPMLEATGTDPLPPDLLFSRSLRQATGPAVFLPVPGRRDAAKKKAAGQSEEKEAETGGRDTMRSRARPVEATGPPNVEDLMVIKMRPAHA